MIPKRIKLLSLMAVLLIPVCVADKVMANEISNRFSAATHDLYERLHHGEKEYLLKTRQFFTYIQGLTIPMAVENSWILSGNHQEGFAFRKYQREKDNHNWVRSPQHAIFGDANHNGISDVLIQAQFPDEVSLLIHAPRNSNASPSIAQVIDNKELGISLASDNKVKLFFEVSHHSSWGAQHYLFAERPGMALMQSPTGRPKLPSMQTDAPNDVDKPGLIDHCGFIISHPPNSNGLTFSRGCSYAFVKPPVRGRSKFNPSLINEECAHLEEARAEINAAEKEGEAERLLELIQAYDKLAKQTITVDLGYKIGWQDLIQKYRQLNPGLKVKWQSIPIAEGQLVDAQGNEYNYQHKDLAQDEIMVTQAIPAGRLCEQENVDGIKASFPAQLKISYQVEAEKGFVIDYISEAQHSSYYDKQTTGWWFWKKTKLKWHEKTSMNEHFSYYFFADSPEISYQADDIESLSNEMKNLILDNLNNTNRHHLTSRTDTLMSPHCNIFAPVRCLNQKWKNNPEKLEDRFALYSLSTPMGREVTRTSRSSIKSLMREVVVQF